MQALCRMQCPIAAGTSHIILHTRTCGDRSGFLCPRQPELLSHRITHRLGLRLPRRAFPFLQAACERGVHTQVPMNRRGTVKLHAGGARPAIAATTAWYARHVASAGCACDLVSTLVDTEMTKSLFGKYVVWLWYPYVSPTWPTAFSIPADQPSSKVPIP
eukprot:6181657-Pleurochrysis_carterae.AAC.4